MAVEQSPAPTAEKAGSFPNAHYRLEKGRTYPICRLIDFSNKDGDPEEHGENLQNDD